MTLSRARRLRTGLGRTLVPALALLAGTGGATADDFDRVEGETLRKLASGDGATPKKGLNAQDLEGLPEALRDARSAFLVVETSQGNLARLLVAPALHKAPGGASPTQPVLLVERFDTFAPGRLGSRTASGRGLVLFEGFRLDLDSGQVVPDEAGGDLVFEKGAKDSAATLKPLVGSRLFAVEHPVVLPKPGAGPSAGSTVVPSDFNGRYRLDADGRWTGLLEMRVQADRTLEGTFRSEPGGTVYPVKGQVAEGSPHELRFTIQFPRTEQEYEGFLATSGKLSLAGSFRMGGRAFGFHALREP